MSEFEKWKEEQERIHNDYDAENAWYAGAQSKQAEIDEYKEVASSMEDAYLREKLNVDELRKRIDEAIKSVAELMENTYNIDTMYGLENILNILSGEENERS